jgi:hypothetical protein
MEAWVGDNVGVGAKIVKVWEATVLRCDVEVEKIPRGVLITLEKKSKRR